MNDSSYRHDDVLVLVFRWTVLWAVTSRGSWSWHWAAAGCRRARAAYFHWDRKIWRLVIIYNLLLQLGGNGLHWNWIKTDPSYVCSVLVPLSCTVLLVLLDLLPHPLCNLIELCWQCLYWRGRMSADRAASMPTSKALVSCLRLCRTARLIVELWMRWYGCRRACNVKFWSCLYIAWLQMLCVSNEAFLKWDADGILRADPKGLLGVPEAATC